MTEETIFAEAIGRPPGERSAYLDEACGDDTALRERVEVLLHSHEEAGSFLAKPVQEDFDATLDISFDDQTLIAARSEELRKSQAARSSQPAEDHEPSSVNIVVEPDGKRVMYFGDYELQGEIARGAMGVVYRAEQKSLKRTVAIKMIRSTMLTNEVDVARFHAEAEAAASLDHPNIVPIYEVGVYQDQHYFSMKLIEGGTLRDYLGRFKKDPKAAAKLMSTVAGAIHTAHQRGILHRDLKPGNILIDKNGEPHVTDFGLAKQMESNNSVTLSGQIMGTPQYMSPEQAEGGGKELTTGADVYSLGAIFYEMLCGRAPHLGESLMDTLKLVAEAEAAPLKKYNAKLDRDLETIAMKCLEKDPAKRYASAQGLKNDLDRWLAGEPIEARPVGTPEKFIKWMRRKPVHASAAAAALLFLLTLGIGGPIVALRQAELREQADDLRGRADSSAELAEQRAEETRRALYASEMHLAQAALDLPGGALRLRSLLDNWRPEEGESDLRGWEWYYLRAQLERSRHLPHPDTVRTAVWSTDGKRLITGCDDGFIRIWDVDSGLIINSIPDERERVLGLSLHGSRLASIDEAGTLRIRDLDSLDIRFSMRLEGGDDANVISWSPDGMRLAAEDGRSVVAVIDIESREKTVLPVREKPKYLNSADWSADGQRLAIDLGDDLVIWTPDSGEVQRFENGFRNKTINDVDWTPDDRVVVCGHSNIFIANPETGRIVFHPFDAINYSLRADVRKGDGLIAFAANNRQIYVVESQSTKQHAKWIGHDEQVRVIEWSPDGKQLLSADNEGVRIWNYRPRDPEIAFNYTRGDFDWDQGSGQIVLGTGQGVKWITPPIWQTTSEFNQPSTGYREVACLPGGDRMLVSFDNILALWPRDFSSPIWEVEMDGDISHIRPAPDGTRFMVDRLGYESRLYSAEDGALLRRFDEKVSGSRFYDWSPDGRLAISGGDKIYVLDGDLEDVEFDWQVEGGASAVGWHPNGEIVATARKSDYLVELWRLSDMEKVAEFSGGSMPVRALEWSPNGKLLATGGYDSTLQLWSLEFGRTVLERREAGVISDLKWDQSGMRLAIRTQGERGNLRVCDAGAGFLAEAAPEALAWIGWNIEGEPDRIRHRVERAELLEKLGRWGPATAEWEWLAKSQPVNLGIERRWLESSMEERDPDEAIAKLEEGIAAGKGNSHVAGILAKLLFEQVAQLRWATLKTVGAVSEGGAELLEQPDGSILAAGVNPPGDVYRIEGRAEPGRITAIRLETIPDESLPYGGAGRAPDGAFHLGDFSVERSGESVPVRTAWADFHYYKPSSSLDREYPVSGAIDDDPDSGWDPHPRATEPRMAVFELAEPLELSTGENLTIRLQTGTRGGRHPNHNLGRFRLSLSGHSSPVRFEEIQQLLAGKSEELGWRLLSEVHQLRNEPEAAAEAFARFEEELEISIGNAKAFEDAGDWEIAAVVWGKLYEDSADIAHLRRQRDALLKSGRFAEAAEAGWRCFERLSNDSINWLRLAPALIESGDEEGYERLRAQLLEHTGPHDAGSLDRVIKACLLRPASAGILDRLSTEELHEAIDIGDTDRQARLLAWYHGAAALHAMRSGDAAEAEASIQRGLKLTSSEHIGGPRLLLLAVRALAQSELYDTESARATVAEVERLLGLPSNQRDHDWLIADILRREAEAVLAEREKKK